MRLLLKDARRRDEITSSTTEDERDLPFKGVRCPLCQWRPQPSSVWRCSIGGTPEPPFPACGAVWNTFATGGRCPGCGHQWRWTTCPRCTQASLHDDWYEEGESQ